MPLRCCSVILLVTLIFAITMEKPVLWSFLKLLVLANTCLGRYSSDLNDFLFLDNNFEFVDLSHTLGSDTKEFWYRSSDLCIDYQNNVSSKEWHYDQQSKRNVVEDIPLKNLIVPLIIADVSDKVNEDVNFVLHKHHLDYFINNYFGHKTPCILVFKFGWSRFYRSHKYHGYNSVNNSLQFPGISVEVATWITTAYKNIVGVGVDLPSIDSGSASESPATKVFTDAGVYVLRNVKLDQYLPESSCTSVVLPDKVKESCSHYRLAAICPESKMKQPEYRLHRI